MKVKIVRIQKNRKEYHNKKIIKAGDAVKQYKTTLSKCRNSKSQKGNKRITKIPNKERKILQKIKTAQAKINLRIYHNQIQIFHLFRIVMQTMCQNLKLRKQRQLENIVCKWKSKIKL